MTSADNPGGEFGTLSFDLPLGRQGQTMQPAQDWQLIRRYRCPGCGKRYVVADWKQDPKCRQCGAELRAEDQQGKSTASPGQRGLIR
jgi:DNA-directed RNA polymerase subunit RPC12/RpoP